MPRAPEPMRAAERGQVTASDGQTDHVQTRRPPLLPLAVHAVEALHVPAELL
jgi:hypothetical protein